MNIKELIQKYFAPICFAGGFFWDAFTLGRAVQFLDLLLLGLYYVLLSTVLFFENRLSEKWQNYAANFRQFLAGALLSALCVLYLKSSGSGYNAGLGVLLFLLMVANEYLFDKTNRKSFQLLLYFAMGTMILAFLIPHFVKSVGSIWFLIASLVSLALSLGLATREKECPKYRKLVIWGGFVGFQLLWWSGAIPPVPLVLKEGFVGINFQKSQYSAEVPDQRFWESRPHIAQNEIGKLYYLSSVFAPEDVSVDLEHRWYSKNSGKWILTDVIPLQLKRGGREGGWRFYSRKGNLPHGPWRVETALKDGAVLGYDEFEILPEGEPKKWSRKTLP